MTDHYKILGLTHQATLTDIKKAFRQKALQYHPDKNKNSDAHETFIKIIQAYEVLSNTSKRRQYDYLYDKYVLNKRTTYTQQKEVQWQETVKKATETGKQKGEQYAKNFDLFSKQVMRTALIQLLLDVGLGVLFGEIVNLGFFAGLAFTIAGIYVLTKFQDTTNLIGGTALIIAGLLILWWNLKNVATELMNKKIKNGS